MGCIQPVVPGSLFFWRPFEAFLFAEFPELKSLMNLLAQVGRTPVNSSELIASQDDIKLAMDAGLLGIYEGNEEKVERYKVPEIYRYALDVTRKGQK